MNREGKREVKGRKERDRERQTKKDHYKQCLQSKRLQPP